jgi:hypothetical protein
MSAELTSNFTKTNEKWQTEYELQIEKVGGGGADVK